ncbi:MAG: hypothetical protein ACFE89_01170 [Candidatus Hodarchaeota archaeon]
MVPCIFALLIFVVPLIASAITLTYLGPVYAIIAGVGAYLIILAICVVIWWRGRTPK